MRWFFRSLMVIGLLAGCASFEDREPVPPQLDIADLPKDFTGCLSERAEARCYVIGSQVDTALRFEPQTGRFWFLDPKSGNTYFVNGDLRTGDPFFAQRALAGSGEKPSFPSPNRKRRGVVPPRR